MNITAILDAYEAHQAHLRAAEQQAQEAERERQRLNLALIQRTLQSNVLPVFEEARTVLTQRGYACQVKESHTIGRTEQHLIKLLLSTGPQSSQPHSISYKGDSETVTIQAEVRKANDLPAPTAPQPCSTITPQRVEKEVETFLQTIFGCPV